MAALSDSLTGPTIHAVYGIFQPTYNLYLGKTDLTYVAALRLLSRRGNI